jgi:hypothetical protein
MIEGSPLRRSPGWQVLVEHLMEYDSLHADERNYCLIQAWVDGDERGLGIIRA